MVYGVSWYPEHRERTQMEAEIALMVQAGVRAVRMGEFAWCRLEPREGVFHFEWLDEAVELLAKAGIRSILCTPTACPPAWLVMRHPEILYVDNRGVTRPFGGRRHYCYTNGVFRRHCARVAAAIGERYGHDPRVMAFQIDNEPAQEATGRCHCAACEAAFRDWLAARYGTVAELNRRWGTIFWSQEYDGFDQIGLPVNTIEPDAMPAIRAYYENPSLRLAYERFCSESQHAFQNVQRDALKAHTDKPVTTNGTGVATNSIDYYQSFADLDVYAFDAYPSLRDGRISAFMHAHARGVKAGTGADSAWSDRANGSPYWLLEFVSGGGHRLNGSGRLQPFPGAMRQSVLQAAAHGCELLLHFQFRTFPMGAEQLNYAILDQDGIPRRRFHEMRQTADDLACLSDLLAATAPTSEVAILFDYDTHWALRIKPVNEPAFDYIDWCGRIHDRLAEAGIGADVVPFSADLSTYRLVIAPSPFVMDESVKARLKAYVASGGHLLATFLAAAKNPDNFGFQTSLPCGMTDLFGVRVAEVEPVFPGTETHVALTTAGCDATNRWWLEVLEPAPEAVHAADGVGTARDGSRSASADAQPAPALPAGTEPAVFTGLCLDTFRAGQPVVSERQYGRGLAAYLGTGLDDDALQAYLAARADRAGVHAAPWRLGSDLEAVHRTGNGQDAWFLFNFRKEPACLASVTPAGEKMRHVVDALTGERVGTSCPIPAKGVRVLVRPSVPARMEGEAT